MTRPATSQTYPYQPTGSLRPAGLLLVIAAMLTVLLPEADLRLLAALFALPPLLWLALAWRRARTSLTLTSNALVIRHPFGLRQQHIPYADFAGAVAWTRAPRLGLVYYVARPPFEGTPDPRPPRLLATATAPLADLPTLLADLQAHRALVPQADAPYPPLDDDTVRSRLQGRRLRRAFVAALLFLATPLLVVAGVRVLFTLYEALHIVLPN